MVAQKKPPPLEESSAFHQLRRLSGDDNPIVRVLMQIDGRLDNLDGKVDRIDDRLDRMESDIGEIKSLLKNRS